MFAIGSQPQNPHACPSGGCHTADYSYSGVYNSHKEPSQKALIGQNLSYETRTATPGIAKSQAVYPHSVLGHNPIGNYQINQSVATSEASFAPVIVQPKANQTYDIPPITRNSVEDIGNYWRICHHTTNGLITESICDNHPKFATNRTPVSLSR